LRFRPFQLLWGQRNPTSRTTAELAARQMQAQVFAADIRSRAGALMGADAKVAGYLTKCSCQRRHFPPFIDKPAYRPESTKTIQLAGFEAKQVPFASK
jgi:hypothetical protein